jgi:hypothetical protein
MIEISLATQLASVLIPFLPKLIEITETSSSKAVESLGGKAGEAAWNRAASAWKLLKPAIGNGTDIARNIEEVAKKGDDRRAEALLSWQLEKLTLQDEALNELKKDRS